MDTFYFVETGFISAMALLSDGKPLEVGLIGPEGGADIGAVLGARKAFCESMCQASGALSAVPLKVLTEALDHAPALRTLLPGFAQAFHVQVTQTAACNAHHTVDRRLARWLLAAADRVDGSVLLLTQDLLSVMLGVRRASVSVAAAALQDRGIISYKHGRVTILDRKALESAACECYAVVANTYGELLAG